ncbi:three prime repair exonuclease 2 [Aplysia californica]|uniref:Three prime repair exonuclease 2 n=1 Tax=Aplysia californica TaxID=6500 RepID=A0ABM1VQW8_APLCA|nr:three prime repair exonuclease 2 [Aplysia californica]
MANREAIQSFVLFNSESTGLPQTRPRIIELSFIAVTRDALLNLGARSTPRVLNKLTLCFNPKKDIEEEAAGVNGFTDLHRADLELMKTFENAASLVISFLESLPRPVCIVAHYGNSFHFRLLLAELKRARQDIPEHILRVDSHMALRALEKLKPLSEYTGRNTSDESVSRRRREGLSLSDVKDEPLDGRMREGLSLSDVKDEPLDGRMREGLSLSDVKDKPLDGSGAENKSSGKLSYKLTAVHSRMFGPEGEECHTAENRCKTLLKIVLALSESFIEWCDDKAQPLNTVGLMRI